MDTFLGRALTDPATGLPNIPYFCLIQRWEERRATRRKTLVRVLRLHVDAAGDSTWRSLMWRLCQELRTTDLIASAGKSDFRILLTSPDAENVDAIAERIGQIASTLQAAPEATDDRLAVQLQIDAPTPPEAEKGPCDPCDEHEWPGGA